MAFSWFRKRTYRKPRPDRRPSESPGLFVEELEPRIVMSGLDFILASANRYAMSSDTADLGHPIVPLYTDYRAGGVYGDIDSAFGVTLDGNDPLAAVGPSSFSMSWDGSGPNGYFQFGIGHNVANRPRDIPEFGSAQTVRFMAHGDSVGRQIQVNVFQQTASAPFYNPFPIASQWFTLTTSFADYALNLPAGVRPQDLHAVQFLMDPAHDAGGGTVKLDEVRIDTDGFDHLRIIQSYPAPLWAPTNSPPNTAQFRDNIVYPNRSFLYDNALAVKSLIVSADPAALQTARDIVAAILATAPNGLNGYANARNSGHVLLGDGSVRGAFSPLKTLGDASWFGMALLDLNQITGDPQYSTRAREISDWAEANLKASDAFKGYKGGYNENGAPFPWRATESNIDFYKLNQMIAWNLSLQGDPAAATYAGRATYAGDFVVAMFDTGEGKLWTGTTGAMVDQINTASVPLDVQLWSFLTLAQSAQYAGARPWSQAIAWAETHLTTTDGALTGFTFSSLSTANRVWLEGVGQGAAVYRLRGDTAKFNQALQTLTQATVAGAGVLAASRDSLTDSALGAVYDARVAAAPTAWSLMARANRNPFELFPPKPVITLPFTDTFMRADDPLLGASWSVLNGTIPVQSNAGHVTTSRALAIVNGVTRADVMLQVDATLPADGAQVGLVARQSGPGDTNEYVGRLIRSGASYVAQILRFDNGVATQLASTDVTAFPGVGATTTIQFVVIGVSLKLYVGAGPNNLAAFATDSTYVRGAIGVRGSMGTTIDNFMANDVPAAAPTLPDDFSTSSASNQLDANWEDRAGNFTVGGGMAKASPLAAGNANLSVLRNANYADVVVSADVNVSAGQRIGLVARYQGSGDNTMYFGEIDYRTGTPVARISYSSATTSMILNTAPSAPGLVGNLRFVVVGNGLQLFLGNTVLTFATDTALTQGTVGVRANAGTTLDNFAATAAVSAQASLGFTDQFAPTIDGQLQAVWQIRQGDFQVAGARALGQDPQASDVSSNNPKKVNLAILAGLSTATDVNVSAMVNVDPGKHAGLVLRYVDDNNFYLGMLNNANSATPMAQIYFNRAGALTLLFQAAAASNTGTLQFQAVGGALQLSLNGMPLASVTNDALRAGSVGIRSAASSYANFNVNAVTHVLPFTDDFAVNGSLGASWSTVYGSFMVSGGAAAGQVARNEAILPGVNSTDVVVFADVNVLSGQIAGLVARYSGPGDANNYLGMLNNAGGSPLAQIFYVDATGAYNKIAEAPATGMAGTLRFEVVGSSLRLFLNGTPQVAALDTTLTQGAVGMRGSATTTFDNFNAMPAPAVLPFSDSFGTPGPLSNSWLNEAGNFNVAGGTANSTSAVNVASLPGVNATDVVLSLDVNVAVGQQAGLIARHLSIGNSSYYLGRIFFPSGGSPRAQILRINGGVQTTLADVPATGVVANTFQTLRFEVVGSSLRLFLANTLKTFVTDATRTNGSVGMRTSNTSVDNFNATAYVPAPAGYPFSDDFSAGNAQSQLANTWATRVGDFTVAGGVATGKSADVSLAVLGGVSVADVNLSVDIALFIGQQAGLVAHYNGTADNSMYIAVLDNTSGIPVARIIRVSTTGQQTVLGSAAAPSGTGTLHFQIVGSSLRLLLGAALLVDVIDFNPLAAGSVGIRGSATTFDTFIS